MHTMKLFSLLLGFMFLTNISRSQESYFYPNAGKFNPLIPTPEKFLGYPIGEQHTRHESLVAYFKELDKLSDRVSIEEIGKTFEQRTQIAAVFTSKKNHDRIEEIRKEHLAGQSNGATENVPLVIHLGYNVHGNEPSSSEAAMLTAYYITASENEETLKWLDHMVILMDPVINPDGRDRHSHWANMHKATPAVADPLDREHNEIWPGGRFNHYWFDLNRDWFLATFPETKNRINFFHKWRPYVQTDHHEMGTNSTFYFDPGEEASNNPLVPNYLYKKIYPKYAEYFTKATDKIGSLYFTKEAYDKLYPGYGSSYINFYGGAGFLFEQASSRGHVQETTTIPISFAFTIRNQLIGSLAIIRASIAEKNSLLQMRKEFFNVSKEQAAKSVIKGYLFGDSNDQTRTNAFLEKLLLHRIDVYEMPNSSNYYVPTNQDNHIMVRTIFENQITYQDSSFYDASVWSLIHAYGLPFSEVKTIVTPGKKIANIPEPSTNAFSKSNYAYLVNNTDYNIYKFIYELQRGGVILKSAFRPFSTVLNGNEVKFGYGSIIIPVQQQNISGEMLFELIRKASKSSNIKVHAVETGYNASGVDLGSSYIKTLKKPEACMIVGTGIAASEAGEVWHLLDQRLQMPITKIDILNIGRADLSRYNTMVIVSGMYSLLDKATIEKIKSWVQNGNTIVAIKGGAEWAIKNGFTKENIQQPDTSKQSITRRDFDRATEIEVAKALGGSIFKVDLDTTHPIGFGYTTRKIAVYKNSLTFFQNSKNPYSTVAQYLADPLVGGYVHPTTMKKIKGSAAVLVGSEGMGRVIMFADEPNFRGTWYGTNKLFLNAVFYGNLMNIPQPAQGEE